MEAGINGVRLPPPQVRTEVEGDYPNNSKMLPYDDPRPPQIPPKESKYTNNTQTIRVNGHVIRKPGDGSDSDDAADFYRAFRNTPSTKARNDLGATSDTNGLQQQAMSSLRSNSNGTTPKHPPISTNRPSVTSTIRSVPVQGETKTNLNTAKSSPSLNGYPKPQISHVKEMARRLNEQGGQRNYHIASKTAANHTDKAPSATLKPRTSAINASLSYSRLQRSEYSSENQQSSNHSTNVPRVAGSRTQISKNKQASQSMTNLSPTSPVKSPNAVKRKPLFGEVIPDSFNPVALGYGIPNDASRRTSDSSIHLSKPAHQKSSSDLDAAPSSPTAWYRSYAPVLEEADTERTPRGLSKHNRSQSDSSSPNGIRSLAQEPPQPKVTSPSRLPVSSRRLASNPDLSRSSSTNTRIPLAAKPHLPPASKPQKSTPRPWSTPGRATTHVRSTTPVQRSPNRQMSSPVKSSSTSSTLKAYISAPPSKSSPPLRSSRPRQTISTATSKQGGKPTASVGNSSVKSSTSRAGGSRTISRQTTHSPVDFAAHRAQIQKKVSKTIREAGFTELQRKESHRPSLAQAESEAAMHGVDQESGRIPISQIGKTTLAPTLKLDTALSTPNSTASRAPTSMIPPVDSPTLGIPGSFPVADDVPASAVSNATMFTEIDLEPQTEAARENSSPLSHSRISPNIDRLSPHLQVSEEAGSHKDDGSIDIILDTDSPMDDSADRINLRPPQDHPYPQATAQEDGVETSEQAIPHHEVDHLFGDDPIQIDAQEDAMNHIENTSPHPSGLQSLSDLRKQLHDADDDYVADMDDSWSHMSHSQLQERDTSIVEDRGDVSSGNMGLLGTPITEIDYESSDGPQDSLFGRIQEFGSATVNIGEHIMWPDEAKESLLSSSAYQYQPLPDLPLHTPPIPPPKEKPQVPPKSPSSSPQPSPNSPWGPSKSIDSPQVSGETVPFTFDNADPTATPSGHSSMVTPVPPAYSPPPPPNKAQPEVAIPSRKRSPPPASLNRYPSSTFTRGARRDSESRRPSVEELFSSRPSISSPRSNSQISFEQDVFTGQTSVDEQSRHTTAESGEDTKEGPEHRVLRHRQMTIKELIDTEAVYLKDMNVVEEIYKGTAEACPKLLPGDIKTIFRNTDQLVAFSTKFLDHLKLASATIYTPRSRARQSRSTNSSSAAPHDDVPEASDFTKDRLTRVGEVFLKHTKEMEDVYTDFLKSSEHATSRLMDLQADASVKVWLAECAQVAKDLTGAWSIDALLVKPVQRITRYQLLLGSIRDDTPKDHPDYQNLEASCSQIANLLTSIDELKRRIDTVSKIVGGKRKESDVRTNLAKSSFAKAFGRREKGPSSNIPASDDEIYSKLCEKYSYDYIQLQVVLRDVEMYTRRVSKYVHEFLRLLSAVELVVRVGPSSYPQLESKWVQFNMYMREMGTVGLENHISAVRKRVIEPIEQVIRAYSAPGHAMEQRAKRRQDYDKFRSLDSQKKKVDEKVAEQAKQYEALNETLKLELPKLTALTGRIANMCLIQLVAIEADWYRVWQDKLRTVLDANQIPRNIESILDCFHRDFKYQEVRAQQLGLGKTSFSGEGPRNRYSHSAMSQSQSFTKDDESTTSRSRPSTLDYRPRGFSATSDHSPSLPTPDFGRPHDGQFTFSPVTATAGDIPQFLTRDYPVNGYTPAIRSGSSMTPDIGFTSRPYGGRPGTGRSFDSGAIGRGSGESYEARQNPWVDGSFDEPPSSRPFSGMFHSAMPPSDGVNDTRRSSRASSQERGMRRKSYNVLFLAASLFEFNISAKTEAGYPYLTYTAGEIFDVVGEKGEIWLAKNQDDASEQIGWIWSKHFARLASE